MICETRNIVFTHDILPLQIKCHNNNWQGEREPQISLVFDAVLTQQVKDWELCGKAWKVSEKLAKYESWSFVCKLILHLWDTSTCWQCVSNEMKISISSRNKVSWWVTTGVLPQIYSTIVLQYFWLPLSSLATTKSIQTPSCNAQQPILNVQYPTKTPECYLIHQENH